MKKDKPELALHEEILLLALRDEKGTVQSGTSFGLAIGGAILSELVLAKCITIEEGKKKLVEVAKVKRLYDPTLDEALGMVASAKRRASAVTWVGRFRGIKRLHHRIANRLSRRGILKNSQDKVLLLFTRKIYPTIDPGPERRLIARLRKAVFSDGTSLKPRTTITVALANATGLLRVHFDRKKLKQRKKRLDAITKGDLAAGATLEAVQAAQAAMVAIAASTVVVSSAGR